MEGKPPKHGETETRASASRAMHTPCSSSLSSCSGTLGELAACRRHWMLSSGTTYSSTSLRGSPRAVPCLAVEGMASSKIAPLRVVSCGAEHESSVTRYTKCKAAEGLVCMGSQAGWTEPDRCLEGEEGRSTTQPWGTQTLPRLRTGRRRTLSRNWRS